MPSREKSLVMNGKDKVPKPCQKGDRYFVSGGHGAKVRRRNITLFIDLALRSRKKGTARRTQK